MVKGSGADINLCTKDRGQSWGERKAALCLIYEERVLSEHQRWWNGAAVFHETERQMQPGMGHSRRYGLGGNQLLQKAAFPPDQGRLHQLEAKPLSLRE